jgi:putative transposase
LFRDDRDRLRFLDQLAEGVEQRDVRLYLYCLMANHFHLVFETPRGNCSAFMHGLLTAYTVYFNRRHDRHGHLMDGRYGAKLVEGDEYLLALSRYVHLNPAEVKGGAEQGIPERVKYLRGYRWSSYPSYIGRRKREPFVTYGPILGMMPGRAQDRPATYRRFVEAGLARDDEEFAAVLAASSRSIGGEGFRAWVDRLHREQMEERIELEDIAFRHTRVWLKAEEILEIVAEVLEQEVAAFRQRRRDSCLRAVASGCLIRYGGLSQRDAARVLQAGSGAAISKQLSRFAAGPGRDKRVIRQMRHIETRLERLLLERGGTEPKS